MKLKRHLLFVLSVSLLLITQTAHADFRKALDAYIARDGETMLKEVKDAVDKKNDDGIILFLSILKQYPKTWRPTLNEAQKAELFDFLEQASSHSSLQAQYKLAIIPRKENNPPPIPTGSGLDREAWYEARKQEKLKEYQDEITRLKPVANKGYAPAALHLYGSYAHNLTNSKADQDNAIQWLKKAADLGSAEGQFALGMKYLNVVDDAYGCTSGGLNPPNCQLQKDEPKGWYWMQQAARTANSRSIFFSDIAYEISRQYSRGVAGNKPNYVQAYLWRNQILTRLSGRVASRSEYKLADLDNLLKYQIKGKHLNQPPALLEAKFNSSSGATTPILTIQTNRWISSNQLYSYMLIDVYTDGRVNLLMENSPIGSHENSEIWLKLDAKRLKNLMNELGDLSSMNLDDNEIPCTAGCIENFVSLFTYGESEKIKKVVLKARYIDGGYSTFASKFEITKALNIIEKNIPIHKFQCDLEAEQDKKACIKVYAKVIK